MSADKTAFVPHSFSSEVRLLPRRGPTRLPKIILSQQAYAQMCVYVEESDEEVGWLGTAIRRENGDIAIEKVFLFKQTVSPTETEISTEGIAELAAEFIGSGEAGMEDWNNMRFWGHSHVRMGTSPSPTDENTMVRSSQSSGPLLCFQDTDYDFAVRGIFNKFGRAQFSIFLYSERLRIDDAEWTLADKVAGPEIAARHDPVDTVDVSESAGEPPPLAPSKYVPEISQAMLARIRAELDQKVTSRSWRPRLYRPCLAVVPEKTEAAPESAALPNAQTTGSTSSPAPRQFRCRCGKCAEERVVCSQANHLPANSKRQVKLPASKSLLQEERSTSTWGRLKALIWRAIESI